MAPLNWSPLGIRVWPAMQLKTARAHSPRFRLIHAASEMTLREGETLVCGPMAYEVTRRKLDKSADQTDLPIMDNVLKSEEYGPHRSRSR